MAKYSFKFKMMIVKECCNGKAGYKYLAHKYNLRPSMVKCWVTNYNYYGQEALQRSRKQKLYTFEFKLHVVELYLSGELSYQQLALQVGMTNPATITRRVNEYRLAGPEALKTGKKGRKRNMDKDKLIRKIKDGDCDEQKELLKQLQEENLHLRIENAFLKEMRRLRLEEEALLKKQRESSTASEENSN